MCFQVIVFECKVYHQMFVLHSEGLNSASKRLIFHSESCDLQLTLSQVLQTKNKINTNNIQHLQSSQESNHSKHL